MAEMPKKMRVHLPFCVNLWENAKKVAKLLVFAPLYRESMFLFTRELMASATKGTNRQGKDDENPLARACQMG